MEAGLPMKNEFAVFCSIFFVSNVHIYIKSVVVFSFEVREEGMRCFSVRVSFLVPCTADTSGTGDAAWRLCPAQQGKVMPPENQGENFHDFSI